MALITEYVALRGSDEILHSMATRLCREMEGMSVVDDRNLRSFIHHSGMFVKTAPLGPNTPGPCARGTGNESLAAFLVLGTNDQMFKRIATAYHVCFSDPESTQRLLFFVQSDAEAWWRHNKDKAIPTQADGNRSSNTKFKAIFSVLSQWPEWCDKIGLISISTTEGEHNYRAFIGSSH